MRTTGWLLLIFSSLGIVWPFAPMHLRETLAAGGGTWSDTMHNALGGITQVFFLLSMGFAAAALGKSFRIYSVFSFLILIFFGVMTFLDSPGVATNQPTPLVGVWERINIGVFLVWVVVLAVILIRPEKKNIQGNIRNTDLISGMKSSMTFGGIGPGLALLCLPYIILSIIVMIKDPEFSDLKILDFPLVKIWGFFWLGLGIIFWICSAIYFLRYFKPVSYFTELNQHLPFFIP